MQMPVSILDIVHTRLVFESNQPPLEPSSKLSVDKCTNIICDLLLTKNRETKKLLYAHPIWEFIFQNINEASPLLGTVIVFKYFFHCFGRLKSLPVLPSLLDAFATLPLDNNSMAQVVEVKHILQMVMDEAA